MLFELMNIELKKYAVDDYVIENVYFDEMLKLVKSEFEMLRSDPRIWNGDVEESEKQS
ncbi:MAG: hypothetical protein IPK55_11700 [Streptococcus sp.]|nr:hypothetical protein [Streptococcus sp.]